MLKIVVASFMGLLLFSCKNSNTQKSPVTIKEFIKLYKPASFPVNIADSDLTKFGDTTVDYTTFTQFIPDSAIENILNSKADKFIVHPAGLIHTKQTDYLITNFTSSKINKLVVFVLDDKHHYKTALSLLNNKSNNDYDYSVSITNEPTFIIRRNKKNAGKEEALYSRNGFSYSAATNAFAEVLNDSNEDSTRQNEIINPVDTFAYLNKFSGDYVIDKKNFISVRDGKSAQVYIFFIHFEKGKDCTGELKGEMRLTDATNAVYQESGDPCVIRFKLSAVNIKVKEEGNCGNYRGINCLIDFVFKKKKPVKSKAS